MKVVTLISMLFLFLPMGLFGGDVPEFTAEGFRVPQPNTVLSFPADHGSHPDYKIEWWYLTGHLWSESGRRFGYQATFFRRALKAGGNPDSRDFGNTQLYLAHMALTDPSADKFYFEERLARDGWDAWARTGKVDVRNGNWHLTGDQDSEVLELQASVDSEVAWSITLSPRKPLVRFGKDGTSRKGPLPEARSFYLSHTRLATSGTVTIGAESFSVNGESWMDHEIASNQLDPSYQGWDWIAIQLKDGWEVKAYILRLSDGSPSPYSALIWIDPQGKPHYQTSGEFTWSKNSTWKSSDTGTIYPNAPEITTRHPISGKQHRFSFRPVLMDQELKLPGSTYWEGAGRVFNASDEECGSAYLELVGYAGAIDGLR